MTKIYDLTKAAFFGPIDPKPGPPPETWYGMQAEADKLLRQQPNLSRTALRHAPGYSLVDHPNAGLIVLEDTTAAAVGIYSGETLMVSPDHGGRNIGASVVVALFERAPWTSPQGKFSTLGARTLRRAHALEVCAAFVRGEDIPDAVREEYGLPLRRT